MEEKDPWSIILFIRHLHGWLAPVVALPLLVVIVTGLVMLLRHQLIFLQPHSCQRGSPGFSLNLEQIVTISRGYYPALVSSVTDIEEIRISPRKGITKVRLPGYLELQIDSHSGAVLAAGKRWSSLILALHEGSFFSPWVVYGVYLPTGLILLFLLLSGVIIYFSRRGSP